MDAKKVFILKISITINKHVNIKIKNKKIKVQLSIAKSVQRIFKNQRLANLTIAYLLKRRGVLNIKRLDYSLLLKGFWMNNINIWISSNVVFVKIWLDTHRAAINANKISAGSVYHNHFLKKMFVPHVAKKILYSHKYQRTL